MSLLSSGSAPEWHHSSLPLWTRHHHPSSKNFRHHFLATCCHQSMAGTPCSWSRSFMTDLPILNVKTLSWQNFLSASFRPDIICINPLCNPIFKQLMPNCWSFHSPSSKYLDPTFYHTTINYTITFIIGNGLSDVWLHNKSRNLCWILLNARKLLFVQKLIEDIIITLTLHHNIISLPLISISQISGY